MPQPVNAKGRSHGPVQCCSVFMISYILQCLGRRRTTKEGCKRLQDLKQSLGGFFLFHCCILQLLPIWCGSDKWGCC